MLAVLAAVACNSEKEQSTTVQLQELPVIQVIQQDIDIEKEFVGQIYGELDIPINARVDGFLDGIHFNEGTYIKKGQLLYTIDAQPFQAAVDEAKSQLAQAQIEAVRANNELERYEPLIKSNAVSKSDYDAVVAEKGAADAAVKASQARLSTAQINYSYTRILSPIDGLIGKSKAKIGEYVGQYPNPVILNTVSKIDSIRVEFFITENDYLTLAKRFIKNDSEHKTEEKRPPLSLILGDGTIYNQPGKVDFIDRGVEESTGSILVQSTFANPDGLIRPGQFGKILASVQHVTNAILVPQRCVIEYQGNFFVMLLGENNVVKQQPISVVETYRDYFIVSEGLDANSKIVLSGLQSVKDGMTIEPKDTVFTSQYKTAQ